MTTGPAAARDVVARRARRGLAGCLVAISLAGLGCQHGYRSFERQLVASLDAGRYSEAQQLAAANLKKVPPDDSDRAIYLLEAGRAAQVAGDAAASRLIFDELHERLRPYLDEKAEASIGEAIATTAVNQTLAEYRGTPPDRVLASALNAVNLLVLGDLDAARVELNRAEDWQQDAVAREQSRIDEAMRQVEEDSDAKGISFDADAVMERASRYFENLERLTPYADFANPFVDHLRGVYFLAAAADESDLDKARFAFRRVASMVPDAAPLLAADLEAVDQARRGGLPPTTWVYFLTGLAPRLEEFRLDIPIPVGPVNYVSAAFPMMKFDPRFSEPLVARRGDLAATSVTLADMDRIVGTEFRGRLPVIVTQEVLSSALKTAATYGLREGLGTWGQVAGIIYQAVSTSADTRSWRSIPKRIAALRIRTPEEGRISLSTGGRSLGELALEPGTSNVVLVTLPSSATPNASIITARLREPTRTALGNPTP